MTGTSTGEIDAPPVRLGARRGWFKGLTWAANIGRGAGATHSKSRPCAQTLPKQIN